MEKNLNYPNFIIVGGIKCGTTSIWLNLDKHPDINMIYRTLPNRISYEMKFWKNTKWNKGFEWYYSHFDERINGEKCAGYYNRKASMVAIANHIPDVKLIFSVRHPVDRMHSNFDMNKFRPEPKVHGLFQSNIKKYKGASMYYQKLEEHILPFFKREQIHICIMERLKENTTEEMNKILSFLGISQLDYESKETEIFGRTIDFLKQNREENFFRKWSLQKTMKDMELRKNLMQDFEPDIQKLKEFLNDDIPEWRD